MDSFSRRKQLLISELNNLKKRHHDIEKSIPKNKEHEKIRLDEKRTLDAEEALFQMEIQDLLEQITKMQCQIRRAELICLNEQGKVEANMRTIDDHKKEFVRVFESNVKEETEPIRVKEEETPKQNLNEEITAVESELREIEANNSIIEKRNKAVLLRLRHHLQEIETSRRRLMNELNK